MITSVEAILGFLELRLKKIGEHSSYWYAEMAMRKLAALISNKSPELRGRMDSFEAVLWVFE